MFFSLLFLSSYYVENKSRLKAVPIIKGSKEPVEPSMKTIENGTYPFARPLFLYVSSKSANKPHVEKFVKFYIETAPKIAAEVGFVPMSEMIRKSAMARFENRIFGSVHHATASAASRVKQN